MDQKVGAAAIVSMVSVVASFIASLTGNPIWGLVLGLIAVPAGVIGVVMSGSPKVRGGIISIIAIVLALIALGLAVLVMIGTIIL